jgi:hypothetical protein
MIATFLPCSLDVDQLLQTMQVPLGTVHDCSPILSTTIQRYVALQESGIYSHELRNATTRIWLMYVYHRACESVGRHYIYVYCDTPIYFPRSVRKEQSHLHSRVTMAANHYPRQMINWRDVHGRNQSTIKNQHHLVFVSEGLM